jgi:hypothetical protein
MSTAKVQEKHYAKSELGTTESNLGELIQSKVQLAKDNSDVDRKCELQLDSNNFLKVIKKSCESLSMPLKRRLKKQKRFMINSLNRSIVWIQST